MTDRILEGRTALVTGSTSGIGLGIALLCAWAGAKVMLNGFGRPEDIARARAEVGAAQGGGNAAYSAADLSRPEQVRQMVREAEAALPGMKARGWGRIINIASAHGLVASPYKVAYVAAKHAVVGMTKTVALEIARTPITCNAICPGFVRTPLAEAQIAPLARQHGVSEQQALEDHLLEKQPSKRWVEVEDVARMALYLCGPGSGSVNGAALSIDGGWLAA